MNKSRNIGVAITVTCLAIVSVVVGIIVNVTSTGFTSSFSKVSYSVIILLTLITVIIALPEAFFARKRSALGSKRSQDIVLDSIEEEILANLDRAENHAEIEHRQLELEAKRLELQDKSLEIQRERLNYTFDLANRIVDQLSPSADQETKAKLLSAVLPRLLQVGTAHGSNFMPVGTETNQEQPI